jgi:hypothetical protein
MPRRSSIFANRREENLLRQTGDVPGWGARLYTYMDA